MRRILVSIMVTILWMGLVFNAESLAGLLDTFEEQIIVVLTTPRQLAQKKV